MRAGDRDTVDAFDQAVAAIPHILQAQRLFGDPDYLLRIITRDLPAYQRVYGNRLAALSPASSASAPPSS
jgi:DNA-binding Lrp family transcriptional regulator